MKAEEFLDRYLRYLKDERRLSPHTLRAYARDIRAFLNFIGRESVSLTSLDSYTIRQFAAECHRKGLGPRSISRRLSAVRRFLGFLVVEKELSANPSAGVQAPKPRRRLPARPGQDERPQPWRGYFRSNYEI